MFRVEVNKKGDFVVTPRTHAAGVIEAFRRVVLKIPWRCLVIKAGEDGLMDEQLMRIDLADTTSKNYEDVSASR